MLGKTEFRRERARETDRGSRRISIEAFEALPTSDPSGYHAEWRQLLDGRWVVFCRGVHCGYHFLFCYRPILTVSALSRELSE